MWSLRQEQIGGGTTDRSENKTLRTTFHEQLTELVADTARMCAGAAEMNNAATLLPLDDEHPNAWSMLSQGVRARRGSSPVVSGLRSLECAPGMDPPDRAASFPLSCPNAGTREQDP